MNNCNRVVTGIRPTGDLHLGNLLGAIRPLIEHQAEIETYGFMADLHAYTESSGQIPTARRSIEGVKVYLAAGCDPQQMTLYRQCDVPEVSQLAIALGMVVNMGRLASCTTLKEKLKNREFGEVSSGLVNYPVLMAADIFAVRATLVPVGEDQVQHVEMARDFGRRFNHVFDREVFRIPQVSVTNPLRVPGLDGSEKMGKSLGNTLRLLDTAADITKKIRSIPTQVDAVGDMTSGTQALYKLMELCSPPEVLADFSARYAAGERKFFGTMKLRLAEDINRLIEPIRDRYATLDDDTVRHLLATGASRVRRIASEVINATYEAMGLSWHRPNGGGV